MRNVGIGRYSVGPPPEDGGVVIVSVVVSAVVSVVPEESSEGVGSDDATVIIFDESIIDRSVAVEVAKMRIVYVPLSTTAPAVFVPFHIFGVGFVTLELEYSDLINAPLSEVILIETFTASEKAVSMTVVVARPDSTVAVG